MLSSLRCVVAEPGRNRTRARLSAAVGTAIAAIAILFVARRMARDWEAAEAAIRGAAPAWLVLALLLAAGAMTAMAVAWRPVLGLVGVRVATGRVIAWYFVGEIGKYLPGGVWPILGRGELARRGGIPRARAYASVGLSLALLYLTAMFVAVLFLPFALTGSGSSPWMLVLLALPVGVLLLHHRVLEWVRDTGARMSRRDLDVTVPRWRQSLQLMVAYSPSWLLVGASTWAVARALDPTASFPRLVFAAVLSWIAGFVAVPVPAGAGVREAVIVATSGLGGGVAVATALIARLLFVIVDGAGALFAAPVIRRRRRGATVGPLPEDEVSET